MEMEIDVMRLAKLAGLKVFPEEMENATKKMYQVIEMVKELPEMEQDCELLNPDCPMELREDIVKESMRRDVMLENAPQTQAGCIVVPKVRE